MTEQSERRVKVAAATVLVLAFLQTSRAAAEPVNLYVSPQGKDSWSGKLDSPNDGRTDGPFASDRCDEKHA